MDEPMQILVHPSKFPGSQKKFWEKALSEKRVPSAFLYEGSAQAAYWLQLFRNFSPANNDDDCRNLYANAFAEAVKHLPGPVVHLAAICGGDASKETNLILRLRSAGKIVLFTAADGSSDLLLAAHETINSQFKGLQSHSILMELEQCSTLPALLKLIDPMGAPRIVTFFGTLHNLAPERALSQVIKAVRTEDLFLLSANLAPADNYDQALEKILEGYDNEWSLRWFWGALNNLGIYKTDGCLKIGIQEDHSVNIQGLKKIAATFEFTGGKEVSVLGLSQQFDFGDILQLFNSRRFTPPSIGQLLDQQSLSLLGAWETDNEGVYLCRRKAPAA